ncbi:PD-(D/E)XK nuclease family protein [Aminobacter sp. J44]|uniref:PDDEXK-like family protein n=1 Tax=Aminobacter sp. J44 TaxID=935262 RepID=UPI0016465067|nr:PD-(D/E)XK nuclease family protein [Aminobacter sp. J44]
MADIEEQLERLLVEDEDFRALEKELDRFCPFEALGMVRSEVRHGNFLAYFLDPMRPHGFHASVLRAFLRALSRTSSSTGGSDRLRPLEAHLMDLEQAEVRREWRNIDLLIVLPSEKIVIPIELKIDASQGDDQLRRYRRIAEEEWPREKGWRHLNVFLTKHDEVPRDDHWQRLKIEHLANEFDLIAKSEGPPAARDSFQAYLKMLRRHHLEDRSLEELARKLWSRHKEALEFLADRRPDAVGNLFSALRDRGAELAKSLSDASSEVVLDADSRTIIRFAFKKWDNLPHFKCSTWTESNRFILLELKRESDSLNGYLYLGPGDEAARNAYVSLLEKKKLPPLSSRSGREWICLAKESILRVQMEGDADLELCITQVTANLKSFAQKVFDHFDPILAQLANMSMAVSNVHVARDEIRR